MTFEVLINFQIIQLSGVCFLKDIILPSIYVTVVGMINIAIFCPIFKLYIAANFVITMSFNLLEFYFMQGREIDSFNGLMSVDKQSTNMTQFTNRLLPLHVGQSN